MRHIYTLQEAHDQRIVGPKAANLARLLQAGFPVPAGFVVTASSLTPKTEAEAVTAFRDLQSPFVAVRSSAINEDGVNTSWAGQLETFLNVTENTLIEKIGLCLQSAGSARAQAYADQRQASSGHVAVLVQAMIPSEVSGVAFTVHPVTSSREQMVIEAGLGLGEAVVSGDITPDTYIVGAASGDLQESFVSRQTKLLRRSKDGGNEWQNLDPPATEPKLSPEQLHELVHALHRLCDLYDFPIDVEWAVANSKFYILQVRPITTLR